MKSHQYYRTSAEVVIVALPALKLACGLPLLIAVTYLVKSAMGIDLMEGPSPLHAYLYWR